MSNLDVDKWLGFTPPSSFGGVSVTYPSSTTIVFHFRSRKRIRKIKSIFNETTEDTKI